MASYLKDAWTRKPDRPSFTRIYNSHSTIVTNILKNEPTIVLNRFKQNSTKIRNDTWISSSFVFPIHCVRKLFNATDKRQMRIKHEIAEYPCYCYRFSNCIAIIRLKKTNKVHIFFVFYISSYLPYISSKFTDCDDNEQTREVSKTNAFLIRRVLRFTWRRFVQILASNQRRRSSQRRWKIQSDRR